MSRMYWNDDVLAKIDTALAGKVTEGAGLIMGNLFAELTQTQGHISPPSFSAPGGYPYMQSHTLADSISIVAGSDPLTKYVVSDAMDERTGEHYSAQVEFGHYWDGYATDWEHGNKVVQVCMPCWVEERPFMRIAAAIDGPIVVDSFRGAF